MPTMEDSLWLTGQEAAAHLAQAAQISDAEVTAYLARLRKELSPPRAALVLEQRELRRRAAVKFPRAAEMFFTRQGLEQATDAAIAAYKAAHFPENEWAADLCCGIGGDLLALAARGPVVGVDRDETAAHYAATNARLIAANASSVQTISAEDFPIESVAAWHIDPDRRAQGRRVSQVENYEPSRDVIDSLLARNPNAAIKLAPAAAIPEAWQRETVCEWIGTSRECKQLVVWLGDVRCHNRPNSRLATVVTGNGSATTLRDANEAAPAPVSDFVGRYLFDPHATVLTGNLLGALCKQLVAATLAPGAVYLTGNEPHVTPLASCFEILECCGYDEKRLRRWLRQFNIGRVEVKKRGVDHDPARLEKLFSGNGEQTATLIVTRLGRSVTAFICRRLTGT